MQAVFKLAGKTREVMLKYFISAKQLRTNAQLLKKKKFKSPIFEVEGPADTAAK